ncbi:MAG: alpha-ribazole phosphatase [Firmicutes bacterium]|nr:alpha-ribazole phosphatase [Bacillota bacterium]
MLRLIIVRHGETVWNKEGKYQGHTDVQLTELGWQQAVQVARRLRDKPVVAVYASDLSRAYETAAVIARKHNLPVVQMSELREINFGAWEGLTFEEIGRRYADIRKRWLQDPANTRLPQGETFRELAQRAGEAVEKILANHSEGTVVLVTHGGVIAVLLCRFLGLDLNSVWHYVPGNSGLTIVDYIDGKPVVQVIGDTKHLSEIDSHNGGE